MNREQLIALGLTEEQADKILAGFGQMVPKSRLDEKIGEVNTLKQQLVDRDTQLEELKKVDATALQEEITRLQQENEQVKQQHDEQLKQIKIDNAVELALTNAKAKNLKAAKALLDLEGVSLDKDGNVIGVNEKVQALVEAEDTKFMFDTTTTQIAGAQPNNQPGNNPSPPDLNNMSYSEMVEYLKNNPGAQI